MIPPSQPIRLRSIARWMKDSDPQAASLPPEELERRVQALDEQMIEAFDQSDSALMTKVLSEKNPQGYEERVQALNMGRLTAWQEITSEFLPPITSLEAED